GAFVAFVVGMSSLNLLSISAPFWALVFGVIASLLADKLALKNRHASQSPAETLPKVSGERGAA
ncbi:MAG TPA: hypothetical protein VKZ94_18400, partial [Advenella sp.]|nr:hypothetical protein [Advenella sp.]